MTRLWSLRERRRKSRCQRTSAASDSVRAPPSGSGSRRRRTNCAGPGDSAPSRTHGSSSRMSSSAAAGAMSTRASSPVSDSNHVSAAGRVEGRRPRRGASRFAGRRRRTRASTTPSKSPRVNSACGVSGAAARKDGGMVWTRPWFVTASAPVANTRHRACTSVVVVSLSSSSSRPTMTQVGSTRERSTSISPCRRSSAT